jgi:transcriptional regulator with XRE-family HTH domain
LPSAIGISCADRRPRRTITDSTLQSDQQFGAALRALMEPRGLSYRKLADETRRLDGRGMTHAHINMLANGRDKPSTRAMELIAQVCEVEPEYFAEYRLAMAMRDLDPNQVGLERALANLNARLADGRGSAATRRRRRSPAAQPRPSG